MRTLVFILVILIAFINPGSMYAQDTTLPAPVQVIFCDDTDDSFNPIKPVTSISKGQNVNFLAKMKSGIGVRYFIWAV